MGLGLCFSGAGGGGGKNGENRGPGGWSVEGCLFWFLCSSQICVPPYSFLKEGF